MSRKAVPPILLAIATIVVLAIAFTNGGAVSLNVFGSAVNLSEGVVLGGAYILGVVCTLPLLLIRVAANAASQQRLVEWEQQDAKLAKQVLSDREKQLEAKIATLETALQKALKR